MVERLVTIEEIQQKLDDCEYAVKFYQTLRDAILKGDFVLFDDESKKFRIAEKNKPLINYKH